MTALGRQAFRYRSQLVGQLIICECEYPLADAGTSTGHDPTCPAHRDEVLARTVGERARLDSPCEPLDHELPAVVVITERCAKCGWSVGEFVAHDRNVKLLSALRIGVVA